METEIKALIDDGLPVVLFDRFYKKVESSYVILDNYKASYNATNYLTEHKFKNIAFSELENE